MNRLKYPAVVFCVGLMLALPALIFGFPHPTHDGRSHAIWYFNFAAQFWKGDLYPRWLTNLNGGLGSPVFFFYHPAPYFITSLFQPFFDGSPHAWRILGLSAALALLLSGLFMYVFLRPKMSGRAAVLGSVLYMALPYHFAIDLHTRGAFAELWSFVWMPLVLFFADKVGQRNVWPVAGLAASYSLLIMTHLPTTLIFSVIPPLYVLRSARREEVIRLMLLTGSGMGLGVGLASIYLFPAMLGQDSVSMHVMRGDDYEHWFLFPHPTGVLHKDFMRALFWIVLTTTGMGASAWYLARRHRLQSIRQEAPFWAAVGLVSVFMMFSVSKPIYQLIPPLQLIEFPWRFNTILVLAAAILLACGMASVEKPNRNSIVLALVFGGAVLFHFIIFTVPPLQRTSFSEPRHLHLSPSAWKIHNSKLDKPEYRPRWVKVDVRRIVARIRGNPNGINSARVVDGHGIIVASEWKPRHLTLSLQASSDVIVEINHFYYPEWTAILNEKTRLTTQPSDREGLIRVKVPAGSHILKLRLAKSNLERTGQRIALVSLLILVALISVAAAQRANTGNQSPL
jgi:6-pyruvoyl-tetrahydropterin synthase related domain